MHKILWSPSEDRFLKINRGKMTYSEIGSHLNRTWSACRNRAKYLGITSDSNLGRKYNVNTKFFAQLSNEACYLAGLIAADGNIQLTKRRWSIRLKPSDSHHLRKMINLIEYTGHLSKNGSLIVSSPEMCQDLEELFSITPCKSKTLNPPKSPLSEFQKLAYIAGVVDGDGSIYMKTQNCPRITFLGTKPLLTWIKHYCDTHFISTYKYELSQVHQVKPKPTPLCPNVGDGLYRYAISGLRARMLISAVEDLGIIVLDRKWSVLR